MDAPIRKLPPLARVDDLELGKAAEHLVVADLILQGYRAYLSDQGLSYDAVIDLDGRLIRLQIKTTRQPRPVPQRSKQVQAYLFHTRRAGKAGRRRYDETHFDLLALVALDIRVIAYMPFIKTVPGSIILRTVGAQPNKNASRLQNIDGFPIDKAIEALR